MSKRGGVDGEQMLRAALFVTPFLLLHQSCFASALILQGAAPRHPLTARAVVILAETDSERRERLRQLFGDDAGKIAERTAPKKKESKPVDVQMLIEGMQRLEWGAVRLVDVDGSTGPLEASFEPVLEQSQLLSVRLDLPLGMLLEEDETREDNANPKIVVAELLEGGSARVGGLEVGDLLRATTAMSMAMSYPTWNLLLGGIGRPKFQKVLLETAGEPFEKIMQALGSNSVNAGGNGQVILFVERPCTKEI